MVLVLIEAVGDTAIADGEDLQRRWTDHGIAIMCDDKTCIEHATVMRG